MQSQEIEQRYEPVDRMANQVNVNRLTLVEPVKIRIALGKVDGWISKIDPFLPTPCWTYVIFLDLLRFA